MQCVNYDWWLFRGITTPLTLSSRKLNLWRIVRSQHPFEDPKWMIIIKCIFRPWFNKAKFTCVIQIDCNIYLWYNVICVLLQLYPPWLSCSLQFLQLKILHPLVHCPPIWWRWRWSLFWGICRWRWWGIGIIAISVIGVFFSINNRLVTTRIAVTIVITIPTLAAQSIIAHLATLTSRAIVVRLTRSFYL